MMTLDKSHIEFIADIKKQMKDAQYRALQKVNKEQLNFYWDIGKTIVQRQKEFGWGKILLKFLHKNCKVNSLAYKVFLLATCGI